MTALDTLHYGPQIRVNARTWGRNFQSRFIEPGVVSYEDVGGDREYLSKTTLDRFAESFVGRPVIIRHSKVTPQTMESKAVGYISRVWYDPNDAWYWCEGVITNDDAKNLIENGWSVSCGYRVLGTDESGGVYHAIKYRRELTAFEGEHLALVENPRYEGATIRLNSKPATNMTNLFKLFKKSAAPAAPAQKPEVKPDAAKPADEARDNAKKDEEHSLSADTLIEVAEGKQVSLGDLVERYNAKPSDSEDVSPESTIEVATGKQVALKDLVARYNETEAARENEAAAKAKEKADGVKAFKVLGTARENAEKQPVFRANSSNTAEECLERGRTRYGSPKAAHGKN